MKVTKKRIIFDDISKFFVYNSLLEKLNETEAELLMSMIKFRAVKADNENIPKDLLNKIKNSKFIS